MIVMADDFLLEIRTEELPPKNLQTLSLALQENMEKGLEEAGLDYQSIRSFATPRRLAVLIKGLAKYQKDKDIERRGPALKAAYDKEGNPTKAALGFAESCDVDVSQLETLKTEKGEWLVFRKKEKGRSVYKVMAPMVKAAVKSLPIAKPMRWSNHDTEFVRPVHSVIMLYGRTVIPARILGNRTSKQTKGHRFHSLGNLTIKKPKRYECILKRAFVIADFDERKEMIRKQLLKCAKKLNAEVVIDENLLNEVAALVEWPVALTAKFPKRFLKIPKEVLIVSMREHQKCFPLIDEEKNLLPYFITVSNIQSGNPKSIIKGNQRVMNARLSDAEFFYKTDTAQSLEYYAELLKNVVFQSKLGTLFDKTQRLEKLITTVAQTIQADEKAAIEAAALSKADLMTNMVGEFPELEGAIGKYYALFHQKPEVVAFALEEQYMPRGADDDLPETKEGQALAIADRIDTLIGIFGINKMPTGDKDPFALRRAAIGLIRIIIEKQLSIDVLPLLEASAKLYGDKLINDKVVEQVFDFVQDRLKYWAISQGFSAKEFAAIAVNRVSQPYDFYERLKAVQGFSKLSEAESLIAANKRVGNILAKQAGELKTVVLSESLLQEESEINLAKAVLEKTEKAERFLSNSDYMGLLTDLSSLRELVDQFFDQVMVMVDDERVRQNRLSLLNQLRQLFLKVADISLL